MFDTYDDDFLMEAMLMNEQDADIDSDEELEEAAELIDIQLEAEADDDEGLEEYGESCKGKKGCTELDDDLDDDDDEIEEALSFMDYDY